MKIYNITIKQLIDYLSKWPVDEKKYQVDIEPQSEQILETNDIIVEHNVPAALEQISTPEELIDIAQSIAMNILEAQANVFTTTVQTQALVTTEQTSTGDDSLEPNPRQSLNVDETITRTSAVERVMTAMQLLTDRRVENNYVNCVLEDISDKYGKLLSVTRHTDDKMCVVINTGTRKFDSVSGNQLLFALHVAECIFREVLYDEQGQVDIQQLDELLDVFYDLMFKNLENTLNT